MYICIQKDALGGHYMVISVNQRCRRVECGQLAYMYMYMYVQLKCGQRWPDILECLKALLPMLLYSILLMVANPFLLADVHCTIKSKLWWWPHYGTVLTDRHNNNNMCAIIIPLWSRPGYWCIQWASRHGIHWFSWREKEHSSQIPWVWCQNSEYFHFFVNSHQLYSRQLANIWGSFA